MDHLSLREQLRQAFEVRRESEGLTLAALCVRLRERGLDLSVSGLWRKLYGDTGLRSTEIEIMATELECVVTAGRPEAA